jgi:3-oxoacyl-[acyl-carrier protein] reductase
MDLGVKDRAYVLLGGSRGMGLATARVLLGEGARVAIISRNPQAAVSLLEEEFSSPARGFTADATQPHELEAAIGDAIDRLGPIRGLLVTTGLTSSNGALLQLDEAQWTSNFQDVFMGTVRACRILVAHMLEQGAGSIVTTGAYSIRAPKAFLFAYSAMKAAILNFTKNLAKTYGSQGIRANCVCPGAFEGFHSEALITEIAAERGLARRAASERVMAERFRMHVALGRMGELSEVADLMAFLLSERAAYLTGAAINIDGGTDF